MLFILIRIVSLPFLNMKRKITLNYPKSAAMGFFSKGPKNEFQRPMVNKASQAIQSPRTVPFFLLVSLLDGYSFPNVLVKGIVAFKH